MDCIQLDYKIKTGRHKLFNNKLFGRIYTRNQNKKKYVKYCPGILHDVPHYKIFDSRLLISTVKPVDLEPIMKYCDKFEIDYVSKDDNDVINMVTGEKRIKFIFEERNIDGEL
jgi:hypothetical protein